MVGSVSKGGVCGGRWLRACRNSIRMRRGSVGEMIPERTGGARLWEVGKLWPFSSWSAGQGDFSPFEP